MIRKTLTALALILPSAALAHDDVKDETVRARMELMSEIGAASKTLGQMIRGDAAFDAATANAALADLAKNAAEIPARFETQADDPKSEARAEIWSNWEDFVAKAGALETAAGIEVSSADELGPAMGAIGGSCKACHQSYRE